MLCVVRERQQMGWGFPVSTDLLYLHVCTEALAVAVQNPVTTQRPRPLPEPNMSCRSRGREGVDLRVSKPHFVLAARQ